MTDPKVNGDRVQLHYGDRIVTLPEQIEEEREEIVRVAEQQRKDALLNRKLAYAAIILIAMHTFLPTESILPFILKLIGL